METPKNISIHREKITIEDLMKLLANLDNPNNTLVAVDIKNISQEVKDDEESLLDMIGASKGHKSFDTAEEADAFIRKERDRWER